MSVLNPYFNFHGQNGVSKEPELYRKMHKEVIRIHGVRFLYAKRELTNLDRFYGEDLSSAFPVTHEIAGWIQNFEGYTGDGDLISKFGLKAHDELWIVVSAMDFTELTGMRVPREGDLILNYLTQEVFEIKFFEHQDQFYPLGAQMTFKLRCETYEPSGEKIDSPVFTDLVGMNTLVETPEEHLENHANNVLIQDETLPIIDLSEKSPFGDF